MRTLRPRGGVLRGRARGRGATFVTTVVLLLAACTVALVVVQQTLSAATAASSRTDVELARHVAVDLAAQFETELVKDPTFYQSELFFAERPRLCQTGGTTQTVVASGDPAAPGVPWPASCGNTWSYVPDGTSVPGYVPNQLVSRAEIVPPSATDPLLHLRVLASVGQTEAALDRTYQVPSAGQVSVYSQGGVNLDTLSGPSGIVRLQGTVYTVGASSTPTRPIQTDPTTGIGPLVGARLASECGFSGPSGGASAIWQALSTSDRVAAGCPASTTGPGVVGDVRTLAPTPLTIAAATRSVSELTSAACPAPPAALVTIPAGTNGAGLWSTSLCLTSGATDVATDGSTVTVASPGGGAPVAYRLAFEGAPGAGTVRVFVASSTPDETTAGSYAAGTHPLSDPGAVWSELGVFPLPRTGVIRTDATTYVGNCNLAVGGTSCTPDLAAQDVSVVAGTPSAPADLVVAGPLGAAPSAALGLVATRSLRVASYARTAGGDLNVSASLFALGVGLDPATVSLTSDATSAGATGALRVTGSLGASQLGPLNGWGQVVVTPADSPAQFVTFTPYWRVHATTTLTSIDLCGHLACADTW